MTQRWIDVRSPDGKLLFRYDPDRDLVEWAARGRKIVVDLNAYKDSVNRTL
jgi:hypothetical protein